MRDEIGRGPIRTKSGMWDGMGWIGRASGVWEGKEGHGNGMISDVKDERGCVVCVMQVLRWDPVGSRSIIVHQQKPSSSNEAKQVKVDMLRGVS